jgi:hypothetical protein
MFRVYDKFQNVLQRKKSLQSIAMKILLDGLKKFFQITSSHFSFFFRPENKTWPGLSAIRRTAM